MQLISASRMRKKTRFAGSILNHEERFVMVDMLKLG